MSKLYSISYYQKKNCWIIQFRDKNDPKKWKTKWMPVSIGPHEQFKAEMEFTSWYQSEYLTNAPKQTTIITLQKLIPMWLGKKFNDHSTKLNSYKVWKNVATNWILDSSDKFPHASIQNIDVNKLAPHHFTAWIDSIPGDKLTKIRTLNMIMNDCIASDWMPNNNPMQKEDVKKRIKALTKAKEENAAISYLNEDQVKQLLSSSHPKFHDNRKILYLFAILTGAREREIQAMTWRDIDFKSHTLYIRRTLVKGGAAPLTDIVKLQEQHMSKDDIKTWKTAIYQSPKSGSSRSLPIHPLLYSALKGWFDSGWREDTGREPTQDDPVFPQSRFTGGVVPGSFCFAEHRSTSFKADLQRSSLPITFYDVEKDLTLPIVFHSLRHTFGSLLAAADVDDATIGRFMGHKAKTITRKAYINKVASFQADYEKLLKFPMPNSVKFDTFTAESSRIKQPRILKAV